jgi:hypothetical protein
MRAPKRKSTSTTSLATVAPQRKATQVDFNWRGKRALASIEPFALSNESPSLIALASQAMTISFVALLDSTWQFDFFQLD